MGKISLDRLSFFAFHGVHPLEQKVGTYYEVSVELDIDLSASAQSDQIQDTIDYSVVYAIIEREMKISSKLIEHVAGRIKKAIQTQFPSIIYIRVQIVKLNPPVKGINRVLVEL